MSEIIATHTIGSSRLEEIRWGTDELELILEWSSERPVSIANISKHQPYRSRWVGLPDGGSPDPLDQPLEAQPAVEIFTVGARHRRASSRLVHSELGSRLRYVTHRDASDADGRRLIVVQRSDEDGIEVSLDFAVVSAASAVRVTATVTNLGAEPLVVDGVAIAAVFGGGTKEWIDDLELIRGSSDWLAENRWDRRPLREAGLPDIDLGFHDTDPKGAISVTSTGSWSTGGDLPTGALASLTRGLAWAWDVETNGAWRWEVGERRDGVYVALSGPTDIDHQWLANLAAGESFQAVPVSLAVSASGFENAIGQLTAHRRGTRRPHPDNETLPVVFNDYMNTLMGDPTTDKLVPLIDAAAETGAEVFVIDAGWYDDSGYWWDSVGEWLPSTSRFPGGLGELIERIRDRGMIPGLWLEPEVIGVKSPMAQILPPDAFLQRDGERIVEHDRFHLDFRHPAVISHLDAVVDRLVGEIGVGYLKLDYNIDAGPGTDVASDSVGAGLLEHNRAHLDWLDGVLDRHPTLILENCASGAMRQDSAMLSRLQLQSTSDQQSPIRYPPIAAGAPLSMPPEQAASWAYPQPGMDREAANFTLVTAMLGRMYVSGYLNRMTPTERQVVSDAIAVHKTLRSHIGQATPFWPLGLPRWDGQWVALGLTHQAVSLIAVWDRGAISSSETSTTECELDLSVIDGGIEAVDLVYPEVLGGWSVTHAVGGTTVRITRDRDSVPSARIFRIRTTPAL